MVDKNNGKRVDILGGICYSVSFVLAMYCLYGSLQIINKPVLKIIHSSFFYTFFIALPLFTFYITMAGAYFKKPSRRLQQFALVIITTTAFTLSYIIQIANTTFIGMLSSIKNIQVIPYSLLEGNIRIVSFIIPCVIVLPIAFLTLKMLLNKQTRADLREYEVEFLLPNIHKIDDTTIDLKLCEDLATGRDCIVPEKIGYEHFFFQGGTGSGKTATAIRPFLGQLFYMKAYLIEQEKKLAYEALNDKIAYLNKPITNAYFNKNFSMELISPVSGKEKEFKEKFKKYIIGIRDKEILLVNDVINEGEVTFKKTNFQSNCIINITIFEHGMEVIEKEFKFKCAEIPTSLVLGDGLKPIIVRENIQNGLGLKVKNEVGEIITPEFDENDKDTVSLVFPSLQEGFTYKVTVREKGEGKIIYKGCGISVVAPDGGLPKDTLKIANEYGIKVHKIDPVMEEIKKGGIAKFNPLKGSSPEKTGDIISSILVSMEQTNGQDSGNNYFTNASVRAVRNLTILLKVMYPKLKGVDPTLEDILEMLNNFNLVVPLVNEMKKDINLRKRWNSVISYFEASFFPPEVDDKGKPIPGATIGSQRKKTEDAITGIINQLDNFLGREEVKYILCDKNDSLNLAEVLERGECIAIATRQNDLGERLGKAFALMFILSMQNAVLSRYSEDENAEVPHYLIIDEFPFYINDSTKVFFTFARKYRCSVTVAIQNMAQLREVSDVFRETIFTNTSTKLLLPKSNVEDREYWSKFFGIEEEFEMQTGISQSSMLTEKPSYSEQQRGTLTEKAKVSEQDLNDMKFKQAFYCYTDSKGRQKVGKGLTDFLNKDENKVDFMEYDFQQFNNETLKAYSERTKKEKEFKNAEILRDTLSSNVFEAVNADEIQLEEDITSDNNNEEQLPLDEEISMEEIDNLPFEQTKNENITTNENKDINVQIKGVDKLNMKDIDFDELELVEIKKEKIKESTNGINNKINKSKTVKDVDDLIILDDTAADIYSKADEDYFNSDELEFNIKGADKTNKK